MRKIFSVLIALSLPLSASAQNTKIDRLEMLFAQKYYKKVCRKADRLLDNPEYDFSVLPGFYKAMSLFQLAQNKYWLVRHPDALEEAKRLFLDVKKVEKGNEIFDAHQNEIAWLKADLIAWASDLKRIGQMEDFEQVQKIIEVVFGAFTYEIEETSVILPETASTIDSSVKNTGIRTEMIIEAKKYIGVPYIWAGVTPDGFDCSGFTSYIYDKNGKTLPRRSVDQYYQSRKIKRKRVEKGDLVFFDNGSGVSHVGIVVSENGQPIVMIHSSSSKGIILTNVDESDYWSQRLHGFGTFIN